MVTRQFERERLALGLPLPPSPRKRRIGLTVDPACVERATPPPALLDVLSVVPRWRAALSVIDAEFRSRGAVLRVFGSLAWQALTGLSYVTPSSDIDLLWQPRDAAALAPGLEGFERLARTYRLVLDGEIVFPEGAAVAIREWMQHRAHEVMVKHLHGAALVGRTALMARLAAHEPAAHEAATHEATKHEAAVTGA